MQQAELMGFLRTILILLLIYYSFRFLARIFAPFLIKKVVGNMQEKAQKRYNQYHQQTHSNQTKEGETTIDKKPNSNKEGNKTVGEYVDFEEID